MAPPYDINLPPGLVLWGGCQIIVHAVDPTDGQQIPGVEMSNVSFEGASNDPEELAYGPFVLVTGPSG